MVAERAVRVALTIAGFDPSGGAGVLADMKTFAAHGVYGEACLTSLTVQNTVGVRASWPLDAALMEGTLACLADDNAFSVIKIGALGSEAAVRVAAEFSRGRPEVPVVLDPVLRSSSGAELLDAAGVTRMRDELLAQAAWLIPNFAELAILAGAAVNSAEDAENAAKMLQNMYPQIYILATGGDQKTARDYLIGPEIDRGEWIPGEWVETRSTHGTGCTLSSALAARIALYPGEEPLARVRAAKRYVEGALRHAPGIGKGHGPLNHFWAGAGLASEPSQV